MSLNACMLLATILSGCPAVNISVSDSGGLERNLVTKTLQAFEVVPGQALGLKAIERIATEFGVRLAVSQQVIRDYPDRMTTATGARFLPRQPTKRRNRAARQVFLLRL